jgi:hypothetical protein
MADVLVHGERRHDAASSSTGCAAPYPRDRSAPLQGGVQHVGAAA